MTPKTAGVARRLGFLAMALFCLDAYAQNITPGGDQSAPLRIPAIPYGLEARNAPAAIRVTGEGGLEIASGGKTNLFNNPNGKSSVQNAPMVVFEPVGDFILSAKVSADLKEVYDVAALVVYQDKDLWAKLCYENGVDKEATVVSVVTREYSDDCNSSKIENKYAYLSIAKKGTEFSFHCSKDGRKWELVRHFTLDLKGRIKVGFAVHCSVGEGFTAVFSDIKYSTNLPEKMRQLSIK
jgi:hypothetical protein